VLDAKCVLSGSKCLKIIDDCGFAPTPLGELTALLRLPSWVPRKGMQEGEAK